MKKTLKSMVFILVSVLIFSSCTGNEAPYTEIQKQEYTAVGKLYCENSASVIVEEGETNLNAVMVKKELTTYKEMLSSNAFLERVSENIGGIYTQGELLDMISMNDKGDNILVVEVTADNPEDALTVCESIFELAPNFVEEITKDGGTVAVLEEPAIM